MSQDFNSRLNGVVPCQFQPGHELHVMTSEAFGTRVLNLRLNRIIPSIRGYTGYTKQGFMLQRDEARVLLEQLLEVVNDDDQWEDDAEEIVPIVGEEDA